jgi:signal transduction histidine kinase
MFPTGAMVIAATAKAFFVKGKASHLIGICHDVTNEMSVERTASSATDIKIDVVDTGVGISEKMKCSLFEPFATTKPSGMGVGLSISGAS